MKKNMVYILFLLLYGCSNDKAVLKFPRAEASARDILEYGRALYAQGKYEQAINEFRYIIAKFPNSKQECAWAQYELAYAYYVMEEYENALNELEKVEMLYPDQSGPVLLAKKIITKIQVELYK